MQITFRMFRKIANIKHEYTCIHAYMQTVYITYIMHTHTNTFSLIMYKTLLNNCVFVAINDCFNRNFSARHNHSKN